MYTPKPYPCWLYHASEPARIVDSYEDHEALGDEWATHPDLVKAPAPAAAADVKPAPTTRKKGARNGGQ